MAGYDFLKTVTVLEVAQLGMDALGGHLADMGARVIKVEALPGGDPVRFTGEHALGGPDGVGLLHLRWNRGKQSLGLDLKTPQGQALFRDLASRADVVIEGLKGGALERLGLGYEVLRQRRPALVFCAISGLGRTGPYHALRSHAVAYDAYAGLVPADVDSPPPAAHAFRPPSIGMQAPGLFAAVGVLAALLRAHTTGEGAQIEVAAVDAAAHWVPDGVDAAANPDVCQARAGFLDETGRMRHWPRLAQYVTRGGEVLLLEAFARPTWEKFCHLVGRADLLELDRLGLDDATYHARLRQEIAAILIQRTRAEWMAAFIAADISAMPVNDPAALARDPHYLARGNWYEVDLPDVGPVRLNGTPIRLAGATFAPAPAPGLGEHGPAILGEVLGLADGEIAALRACGVVG